MSKKKISKKKEELISISLITEINLLLDLTGGYSPLSEEEIAKLISLNLILPEGLICQAIFIIENYIFAWRNITCNEQGLKYLEDLKKANNCEFASKKTSNNTLWFVGGNSGCDWY